MKKKISLPIILVLIAMKILGQNTDSTFLGKSWIVEATEDMFIPLNKFTNSFSSQNIDGLNGSFEVQPSFSADNAFVSVGYKWPVFKLGKTRWETSLNFIYQHLHFINTANGYYEGGVLYQYFQGTVIDDNKIGYASICTVLSCNWPLTKKIDFFSKITLGFGNWLYNNWKETEIGTLSSMYNTGPYTGSFSSYGGNSAIIHQIGAYTNFQAGVLFNVLNHFFLIERIELPIFLVSSVWKNENPYFSSSTSYVSAPYFTTLTQLHYFSFSTGFTYKIRFKQQKNH